MMMMSMMMTSLFVWVLSALTGSHLCVFVPLEILQNDYDDDCGKLWNFDSGLDISDDLGYDANGDEDYGSKNGGH